ncbi:hypothetical protein H9P43_005420 [Blastocladiella emersonii ATCC 22665]|nr:hypothetical protein H9P43_005420 [Blastocladiella emersonii ATCC 22665]
MELFTPAHIVVGPLTRETVSLVANLVIEIVRNKASFDLLQLSVLSPHADHVATPNPAGPHGGLHSPAASPPAERVPGVPHFDVIHATISELRALGIPVVASLDAIAPPAQLDPWVDRMTVPAPAAWLVDLAPQTPIAACQGELAPAVAAGHVRKVCYVRPIEFDASGVALLPHEVLVRYGVLAEDLPYLPLDAPALACPVRAATSALFPEAAIARRNSLARRPSSGGLSRRGSTATVAAPAATTTSVETMNALDGGFPVDPLSGLPQVPFPVVYPMPTASVMAFIVSIVGSRFIYDQLYTVTGAPLQLPGVSPIPATATVAAEMPATTAMAAAGGLTPPPSPRMLVAEKPVSADPEEDGMDVDVDVPLLGPAAALSTATSSSAASIASSVAGGHPDSAVSGSTAPSPRTLAPLHPASTARIHAPVTPGSDLQFSTSRPGSSSVTAHADLTVSTLEGVDDASLEEHLQMLHDHVHAAMGVHLASLRTPSGRTLGGIAMAFLRGQFSVASPDYARVLHQRPPEFRVVQDASATARGLDDSGVEMPGSHTPFGVDAALVADASDLYTLAGGRYTVAVRVPTGIADSA